MNIFQLVQKIAEAAQAEREANPNTPEKNRAASLDGNGQHQPETKPEREVKSIIPAALAGRCANGYERGAGAVIHAIEVTEHEKRVGINYYARSLCGKTHGPRSAGWNTRLDADITCPKCIKFMQKNGEVV